MTRVTRVWSGLVQMDEDRYRSLARLAGPALRELRAYAIPVGQVSGLESRAVYVATTAEGYACYAGKTLSPRTGDNASHSRIGEHMSSISKATEWKNYWVFPLVDDARPAVVAEFESTVCGRLGLPLVNRRWRQAEARIYGA